MRFRSDESMGYKGFSLSYVAVDPFENFDEFSDSVEVTPFPGSLRPKYLTDITYEEEDEEEVFVRPSPKTDKKNSIPNEITSSQLID